MPEDAKTTLTPRMRFPEFRNEPAWPMTEAAGVFANRVEGGTDELPIYSVTMNEGMVKRSSLDRKVDDIAEPGSNKKVCKGDIAYNMMRMWQGACGVAPEDCMVSPAYVVLAPRGDAVAEFFGSFFKLPTSLRLLTSYSRGLTKDRLRLYYSDFARMPLPVPSPAEQQKIADCLTSLDDLIAAQGRKVEALRAHKRGLMQQLFPREGESLPRLRFPEFRDAAEWEEKTVGDVFDTATGGTPDRANKAYWNGGIPWVTTSLLNFNIINSTDETISAEGLENSAAKLFPQGTVLMALYGQGKTRGQVAMLGIEATTNQACAAILPCNEVDPTFTFMNLSGRYEEIRRLSNSGGQENLSQGLVRELPFCYPKDPAEQHRIAACLGSLDARLTAETKKLAALNADKKGLLQQLFPSSEEA